MIRSTGANGKPDDFLTVEQKLGDELTKMLTTQLPPRAADAGRVKAPDDKPRVAAPKKPAQLKTKTAVQYAKALDAMDKGNKAAAKEALQTVVKEQPDFRLAAADLESIRNGLRERLDAREQVALHGIVGVAQFGCGDAGIAAAFLAPVERIDRRAPDPDMPDRQVGLASNRHGARSALCVRADHAALSGRRTATRQNRRQAEA